MDVDGNITKGKPWNFYKTGVPPELELDFAIFALTPGIPTEYVIWIFQFQKYHMNAAHDIVNRLRHEAEPLAFENAATITLSDGWAMLPLMAHPKRKYSGPMPHWCALAVQDRMRKQSPKSLTAELGIGKNTLSYWAKSGFHPLLLLRHRRPRVPMRHFQPFVHH